jgi:hypothetical protein
LDVWAIRPLVAIEIGDFTMVALSLLLMFRRHPLLLFG